MAKEKILDEDLNLCPDELPTGLIEWVRREIIDKDDTLLYKRGNVRGTCFVCGRQVRTRSERFVQNMRVNCPDCGARVLCVLEDGADWKADYVDNIAAAQMGEDGKTIFIRQWHVRRDATARFKRIEGWLQEFGRYAIRGEAVAKWQHEIKDNWWGGNRRYQLDHWERNRQISRIFDGGYTFYMPSVALAVAGTSLQYKDIEKYAAEVQNSNVIRYMLDAARYPVLEFFVKNGYTRVMYERCHICGANAEGLNSIRWQRKRLQDCFRFPLRLLKMKAPEEWKLEDFAELNTLWEYHERGALGESEIEMLMQKVIDFKRIAAATQYASVQKIVNYIGKQRELTKRHNIEVDYQDYLTECRQLNLELHDTQILFPKDLIEAHRRTTAQINFEKNRADQEKFAKAAEELAKYAWSKGAYIIRAAQTQEELRDEGAALHHCVGGYAKRVADGSTAIFFIRRAAEPDAPYYTLELRNKKVEQCRTNHNQSYEQDPAVKAFVDEWLAAVVAKGGIKKKKAA